MLLPKKNNRLSAFCCLLGLLALVPAYFLPALAMTNSVEGSEWVSIWSGIVRFWQDGDWFLAGLIFVFSVVFPIAKLTLTFLCCAAPALFGDDTSRKIVHITGWTAKYSMLDVMVIALLIVMVKIDDYVRVIPTIGLYLFAFAIFCSVLANWLFVNPEKNGATATAATATPGPPAWRHGAIAFLAAFVLAGSGLAFLLSAGEPVVNEVRVTKLRTRAIPRTVEKMKMLKEAYDSSEQRKADGERGLFDGTLLREFAETLQTFLTTDADVIEPEILIEITRASDETLIDSEGLKVDLEAEAFEHTWPLAQPVPLRDIAAVTMRSRIPHLRIIDFGVDEEHLEAAADPYRKHMRTWMGRVFQFELAGPRRSGFGLGLALIIAGLIAGAWGLSCLLVRRPPNETSPPRPS